MKLTKYIGMALAMTALAACSNEDELQMTELAHGQDVDIAVSVGKQKSTRIKSATGESTTFERYDRISIKAGSRSFVTYQLEANGWESTSSTKSLKWETDVMDFEAYHPGNVEGVNMTTFTVPTYQKNDDDIEKADYMTYTGTHKLADGKVSIQMQRKTARVIVKIKAVEGSFASTSTKLEEMKVASRKSLSDPSLVMITPHLTNNPAQLVGRTYTALVLPVEQKITGLSFITFRIGGQLMNVEDIPVLEAGKSYTYNLTIGGKDNVILGPVSVEPWTNGVVLSEAETQKAGITIDATNKVITTAQAGQLSTEALVSVYGDLKATQAPTITIAGPANHYDLQAIEQFVAKLNSANPGKDDQVKGHVKLDMSGMQFDDPTLFGGQYKGLRNNLKLDSISFPKGITEIGNYMLTSHNQAPKGIVIPASVTTLSGKAFTGCNQLTELTVLTPLAEGVNFSTAAFTDVTDNKCVLNIHQSWNNGEHITKDSNGHYHWLSLVASSIQFLDDAGKVLETQPELVVKTAPVE